eukprot:TRINITY_DN8751_c0_g2_i4.p1 TRINITY_DN8751_c0_g2~~TRINITY_DN8751_c0_g2_i4.p1  ORF type:complete len:511 (-),score=104.84 TRINITY_DN8751_c0_g2_i4:606-2138(-)
MLSQSRRIFPDQREDKFLPFVTLLSNTNVELVEAILFTVDKQNELTVSSNLIMILDAYGKIQGLIDEGIRQEVKRTSQGNTLFRSNSTTTKLIKGYTRLHGQSFLQIFCPILEEIGQLKLNLEVNPDKLSCPSDSDKNIKILVDYSQRVFDLILDNVNKFPSAIRKIVALIATCVREKFPEYGRQSVAGYVFLRYLCPAFSVSPHLNGLLDPKLATPDTLRTLLLIGKIIQALANGILFGEKEMYMIPANSFLLNNMQRCNDFLDLISVEPERGIIPRLCSVRDAISVEIPELLKYLLNTDSTEKVYKKLAVSPENSTLERFREIMENYSKDYVVTSVHEEKPYSFRGSKLSNTKYVVLFKKLMSEETVATKKIIEAYRSANKCKNHAISRDEWISICGALLESLSLSPEVQRHKVTSSTDPQMMEFVDNMEAVVSTQSTFFFFFFFFFFLTKNFYLDKFKNGSLDSRLKFRICLSVFSDGFQVHMKSVTLLSNGTSDQAHRPDWTCRSK